MTDTHKLIERLAERAAAYHFESRGEIMWSDLARNINEHFAPLAEAIEALREADAIFAAQGHPNNACHATLTKLDALMEGE